MKERPLLFNGEMVRAILAGTKIQTRRIAKLNASGRAQLKCKNWHVEDPDVGNACPLGQVGDRLWVRETFIQGWETNAWGDIDRYDESGNEKPIKTWYRADGNIDWEDADGEFCENTPWRPSIHMPRSASRITLEITSVHIERLQEISRSDAIAEGTEWNRCPTHQTIESMEAQHIARKIGMQSHYESDIDYVGGYRQLWNSIYKNWDENPYVWVIEFKRIHQ